MLKVIEPRSNVPSDLYFSRQVIPAIYKQVQAVVVCDLSEASTLALITHGWTSRAIESYLTVTAHFITLEWNMKSHVLQTCPVYEEHTSTYLAELLC